MDSENRLTLADVGSYVGARGLAEIIRRNQPHTLKEALAALAVMSLGAYVSYKAGGEQSLHFFAQGFSAGQG